MTGLIEIKQYIINFIGKYEAYVKPIAKLALAIVALVYVNGKLGYMEKIDSMAIILIVALMCSFMPTNFILLMATMFAVLHMYALSLEAAIITLVMFLVLYLIYFRLSPKSTVSVVVTPILTGMGIPYIMPVSTGLVGGPVSGVSIACGIIVSRVLHTININSVELMTMDSDDMASRFRFIIDLIMADKGMILLSVVVIITAVIVHIISQLPVDYSWYIAIIAGAVAQAIMVLIGNGIVKSDISAAGLIVGTVLAIVIGLIVQFFVFNLNYAKTEKLEFQDDSYVYYVKAVPKRTASKAKKRRK